MKQQKNLLHKASKEFDCNHPPPPPLKKIANFVKAYFPCDKQDHYGKVTKT